MRFNNKFFRTEEEAKAFKKEHGGAFYRWSETASAKKNLSFLVEMDVAMDARGESVDPKETPYCVAWNEHD